MNNDIDYEKAHIAVRGRGSGNITKSRFESLQVTLTKDDPRQIKTEVFKDTSKSILAFNNSPDVGFSGSINPYRGCEHGCTYCYARPTHEYFGLSAGLDFETKIFAKPEAPLLLRKAFLAKSYKPQVLALSGVTDCYQPIEKELKITRQCLMVLREFRNPVVVVTKNHLVTRDIDIFAELNRYSAIQVCISITTLDLDLARIMEPRATTPERRLDAVKKLSDAKIPVNINIAPIIPGLTDHEIPKILKAAKEAGALRAHYTMLRLPYGVKDIFKEWVEKNYPDRSKKILNRIMETRGGRLNSSEFGERMVGSGGYAVQIAKMFSHYRKIYDLTHTAKLSTDHFVRVQNGQLSLF